MSNQGSWLRLSVEKFFSDGNWQGQPLENCNSQYQHQSGNLTVQASAIIAKLPDNWGCLSVEGFFNLSNWQGQPLGNHNWQHQDQVLQAPATVISLPDNWECLSVQEFFSLGNWQGQPQQKHSLHPVVSSDYLTMQVKEFFQFMPWEANPEIGSLPQNSSIPDSTPVGFVETTLSNLSDLF
ncbi:MAG: hypothetical protein KME08_18590 [Aphanothece sp. CMT-3BRIN-NPC111]|jgi:hypothetical protein|nr:hypothetical protein [Aphanothece sp. CMT-3BRIN-NPC111]